MAFVPTQFRRIGSKAMIKSLVKKAFVLVILVAVGLIAYNLFYGTEEEKQQSQQILRQIRELTGNVAGLLQSEKAKFDAGKYNDALQKLKSSLALLREQAQSLSQGRTEVSSEIEQLEQDEAQLEIQLEAAAGGDETSRRALDAGAERILKATQALTERIQRNNQL